MILDKERYEYVKAKYGLPRLTAEVVTEELEYGVRVTVLKPDSNELYLNGVCFYRDFAAQDMTLPYGKRPPNWVGRRLRWGIIDEDYA